MCALKFLRLEDFLYDRRHGQAINLEPQGILFADVSDWVYVWSHRLISVDKCYVCDRKQMAVKKVCEVCFSVNFFTPCALHSQYSKEQYRSMYIDDRPTSLTFWKNSNGHNSGMHFPIYFMFGSWVCFPRPTDQMELFPFGPNPGC